MRRDQNVFFNVCTSPADQDVSICIFVFHNFQQLLHISADQHIYPFVFMFFIIFSNCHIYLQINKSTFTLIILCKLRRRSSPILTANGNNEIWKFTLPFRIRIHLLWICICILKFCNLISISSDLNIV